MKPPTPNPDKSTGPVAALLLVQAFFGSLPVIGKIVLAVLPAVSLVGFRVGITAIVLFTVQRYRGRVRLREKSDYRRLAVLSLFGVVFNQLLFVGGLSLTKAANTSLLAITIPIFTLIVGSIVGSERLRAVKIVGILLAAVGGVLAYRSYFVEPSAAVVITETTVRELPNMARVAVGSVAPLAERVEILQREAERIHALVAGGADRIGAMLLHAVA